MKYLHCNISPKFKTVSKRNIVSGHEWPEYIPQSGFIVSGGWLMDREYRTIKAAQDAIHFDFKFNFRHYKLGIDTTK